MSAAAWTRARPWRTGIAATVWSRSTTAAVAVTAGLLVSTSFAPLDWWWSAIIGMAALGWLLTRRVTTTSGALGCALVFGMALYLPLLPWTGAFVGPAPYLALSTVCAVFPVAFAAVTRPLRESVGWPLWWAACWVAVEWLKTLVPFGGFPWGVLAYGQTDGPLAAFARLGGAPLVSFATAWAGFSAAAMIGRSRTVGRESRHEAVIAAVSLIAIGLGALSIWPLVRQSAAPSAPSITVALVQGNVPRLGLDFNAQRRAVLDNHVTQTLRLAEDVAAGRVAAPQIVFWPENSSDVNPLTDDDARRRITAAAAAIDAPILIGTVLRRPEWTPQTPATSNTMIVWNPGTGPAERHDKKIIQPFGEYLPWRNVFRHLSSYADRAGFFVPGSGPGIVHAAGVPVGVATCWEVVFDRAARDAVLAGAQMLVVPSNSATFTEQMSRQQLAFGKLRAIEHDRSVVVASTTGVSAVIAPDGRAASTTAFNASGYLVERITLRSGLAPATRWTPRIQLALSVLAVAAVAISLVRRRSPRRSPAAPADGPRETTTRTVGPIA